MADDMADHMADHMADDMADDMAEPITFHLDPLPWPTRDENVGELERDRAIDPDLASRRTFLVRQNERGAGR